MDPAKLRPDMTLQEIVVLMAAEIQHVNALDRPTPEQVCEADDMRNNLGEFIQHVDQQIGEAYARTT